MFEQEKLDEVDVIVQKALCRIDYLQGILDGQVTMLINLDADVSARSVANCLDPLRQQFTDDESELKDIIVRLQSTIYELYNDNIEYAERLKYDNIASTEVKDGK